MVALKICGFAIICVMMILLLRQQRIEYAIYAGLFSGVVLIGYAISSYVPTLTYMTEVMNESALAPYAQTLLKAVGIGFVVQISADMCRDTGESGIASKLEIAGKAEILILCLPLIKELLALARGVITA